MSEANDKRLKKIGRCGKDVKKKQPGTSKMSAMKICSKSIGPLRKSGRGR